MENQIILDSVDLTVEKLRFSLVRKYFCARASINDALEKGIQIVDNCVESLRNVSSKLSELSVDDAPLLGNCTRGSCSTYRQLKCISFRNSNLKVDEFFSKSTHII